MEIILQVSETEAVMHVEVEISLLEIIQEVELSNVKWVHTRYYGTIRVAASVVH